MPGGRTFHHYGSLGWIAIYTDPLQWEQHNTIQVKTFLKLIRSYHRIWWLGNPIYHRYCFLWWKFQWSISLNLNIWSCNNLRCNSYVPSCQQHLIFMWYSCRHCQRIDFVELIQALRYSPRLLGPLTSLEYPIDEVLVPLRGARLSGVPGQGDFKVIILMWICAMHCFAYLKVLSSPCAVSVLGELSPGGALMHGFSQQQLHRKYCFTR